MNLLSRLIHAASLGAVLLASALLASCGGGDRVENFSPTRLLVFGDETSVIDDVNNDANGRKYTVNALKTDNVALDCSSNAIWIQYLVATYPQLVLPQCNPSTVADPKSRIYAEAGATVADVTAQIDSHLLADTFTGTDLVTVLAGQNDILAQYALFDASNEDTLVKAVKAAGTALAQQVNRIANAGGKVLIVTVPDLGLTPFAIAENAANAGRANLLTRLSDEFNKSLRSIIDNDGRKIGLVNGYDIVQTLQKFSDYYSLTNVTSAVCDVTKAATVELCTTLTLITDGTSGGYLWADATHLSPAGQRRLGEAAVGRATNNPF
jgi:lysophospholipase L1-like esterase